MKLLTGICININARFRLCKTIKLLTVVKLRRQQQRVSKYESSRAMFNCRQINLLLFILASLAFL